MTESSTVYLGLGTNLGDRLQNLHQAMEHLSGLLRILRISSVYETLPWGVRDQPMFLNLVAEAETNLPPMELLHQLKQIEQKIGRTATFYLGPRLIDIDILFYGDLMLYTPELTIPHIFISQRAFVLVPLAELAPNLKHPTLGCTIQELLPGVDVSTVKIYQE